MRLRYGMNPHQGARTASDELPFTIVNGEPSYINVLDALNGWQLVREATAATGRPAAASFKHVSPAGAAIAGELDECARDAWGLSGTVGALASAYARARDGDPKSSFGDMIAVSRPVDAELATFGGRVVADGIIAPGFEPGTVELLAKKKRGAFLILEADPNQQAPRWESREIFGVTLEQERDAAVIDAALLKTAGGETLSEQSILDALVGLVTLRYTQSNSVALVRRGQALGIGAGQQNRVDCVRLAGAKASTWWLRRHPLVRNLPRVEGMSRQERLNWQIGLAEGDMTPAQLARFAEVFARVPVTFNDGEKASWRSGLDGVTLASDGFLPFRDNVDHASRFGVRVIVEPGGSTRSDDVAAACAEHGIELLRTGLRLFHH